MDDRKKFVFGVILTMIGAVFLNIVNKYILNDFIPNEILILMCGFLGAICSVFVNMEDWF